MARSPNKRRIDYSPCPAARDAIDELASGERELSQQALIDKLVIFGLWALKLSPPPPLIGKNRRYWRSAQSAAYLRMMKQ